MVKNQQAFLVIENWIVVREALVVANVLKASKTEMLDLSIRSVISDSR